MDIDKSELDRHITGSPYDEEYFVVCPQCHAHDVGDAENNVCGIGDTACCDCGYFFVVQDEHLMTANEIYDEFGISIDDYIDDHDSPNAIDGRIF